MQRPGPPGVDLDINRGRWQVEGTTVQVGDKNANGYLHKNLQHSKNRHKTRCTVRIAVASTIGESTGERQSNQSGIARGVATTKPSKVAQGHTHNTRWLYSVTVCPSSKLQVKTHGV